MASKLPRIATAKGTTTEEQDAAAQMVHRHATSPEDEHELLDALGLPTTPEESR